MKILALLSVLFLFSRPLVPMMHLYIMHYTYWTPLKAGATGGLESCWGEAIRQQRNLFESHKFSFVTTNYLHDIGVKMKRKVVILNCFIGITQTRVSVNAQTEVL